jgi:sugar O-acyltransferase (sialic acid O-acetyltransferase NeuD family)
MLKRLFDIGASTALLIGLAPVMAAVAIAVRLQLGAPIFFRQRRLGLNGVPFGLFKFRTMTEGHDGSGRLLPDAERLPPFGKWLRSTSLDELPQLVNVLVGDMSLVGPRPLLPQYGPRYSARQARRHEVKPGITGLAQVSGRNLLSWDQRFELDVQYVDTRTFVLDLKILLLTCAAALRRGEISASGHATMDEFMGSSAFGQGVGGQWVGVEGARVHAVFGIGGCGRDVMPHVHRSVLNGGASGDCVIFLDQAACPPVVNGHRAISFNDAVAEYGERICVSLAVADPKARQKLDLLALANGLSPLDVRAQTAMVGGPVTLGPGHMLLDYVTITSNTSIGRCFLANNHASVAHDCVIGDYVTFSPHSCCNGHVHIGDRVFVGAGALIRNGTAAKPLRIGNDAVIAMGAVVINDVAEGQTVAGNPARPMRNVSP